ncbi:unnamed protein product [Pocillopora meandrina]|uniref:Uncharacterized protein n=1 Tax=Pocillopora meandrina TaxID=46732 RepID=A0AAU9WIE5_9CNID|nr:unnamed protein product [Pocillopora meandrina]
MNSKVILVFALFVLAASFLPESEGFTAGGGGNIPHTQGRRALEHQLAGRAFCQTAREHCKKELIYNDKE